MAQADLTGASCVILVFAMEGCPACHDFVPRLEHRVEELKQMGYPITLYAAGSDRVVPGTVPVFIYDARSPAQAVQALADQWKVKGLPTTIVLPRRGHPIKQEGSVGNEDLDQLLFAALAHT